MGKSYGNSMTNNIPDRYRTRKTVKHSSLYNSKYFHPSGTNFNQFQLITQRSVPYFGVEMEGFTRRSTKIMKIENIAEVLAENGLDIYFARYGDRSKSYNKWKIKPEDTITPPFGGYIGFELVSPILLGSAGLVELRNVLDVVKRVLKPELENRGLENGVGVLLPCLLTFYSIFELSFLGFFVILELLFFTNHS